MCRTPRRGSSPNKIQECPVRRERNICGGYFRFYAEAELTAALDYEVETQPPDIRGNVDEMKLVLRRSGAAGAAATADGHMDFALLIHRLSQVKIHAVGQAGDRRLELRDIRGGPASIRGGRSRGEDRPFVRKPGCTDDYVCLTTSMEAEDHPRTSTTELKEPQLLGTFCSAAGSVNHSPSTTNLY